jgi:hypothetical protein
MEETALVQRGYTAVLEHLVKTGRAPHYTELAATLGLSPEEARQIQHKAADSAIACWFVKEGDYVESSARTSLGPWSGLFFLASLPGWLSIMPSLSLQDLDLLFQVLLPEGSSESRRNPQKENHYHPGRERSQDGVNERRPNIPHKKLHIDGWRSGILNGKYGYCNENQTSKPEKNLHLRLL